MEHPPHAKSVLAFWKKESREYGLADYADYA
jgi:hypothetical protein